MEPEPPFLPVAGPIWSEPESAPEPRTSGAVAAAAQKVWLRHTGCRLLKYILSF